jgi:hypothetical protein
MTGYAPGGVTLEEAAPALHEDLLRGREAARRRRRDDHEESLERGDVLGRKTRASQLLDRVGDVLADTLGVAVPAVRA